MSTHDANISESAASAQQVNAGDSLVAVPSATSNRVPAPLPPRSSFPDISDDEWPVALRLLARMAEPPLEVSVPPVLAFWSALAEKQRIPWLSWLLIELQTAHSDERGLDDHDTEMLSMLASTGFALGCPIDDETAVSYASEFVEDAAQLIPLVLRMQLLPPRDALLTGMQQPPLIFRQRDRHFITGLNVAADLLTRRKYIYWSPVSDQGRIASDHLASWITNEKPRFS